MNDAKKFGQEVVVKLFPRLVSKTSGSGAGPDAAVGAEESVVVKLAFADEPSDDESEDGEGDEGDDDGGGRIVLAAEDDMGDGGGGEGCVEVEEGVD